MPVFDASGVGMSFPDLVVGIPALRRIVLVEVKDGSKPAYDRELTKGQADFHALWGPYGAFVVLSVDEALELCTGPVGPDRKPR